MLVSSYRIGLETTAGKKNLDFGEFVIRNLISSVIIGGDRVSGFLKMISHGNRIFLVSERHYSAYVTILRSY